MGEPGTALRTRITFGVLDLVSAGAVFGTMKVLWSASAAWPIALGVWGGLLVASAIGLFSGTRTGRFLARLAAAYQLGFLLVLVVGILSSVAYLSGIYGQVGVGVAVVLLLILALLLELIGLLPIFKLRSIGVLENDQAWLHRTWPFAAVALLGGVALHCVSVHASASLDPWVPISKDAREAAARYLWATAIGEAVPPPMTKEGTADDHWVVRTYRRGQLVSRVETHGSLDEAVETVAATFSNGQLTPSGPFSVAIDRVVAETDIEGRGGLLGALSIVPGMDGVIAEIDGERFAITPHELVLDRMLSEHVPIAFIPDFEIGLDPNQARALLCGNAKREKDCEVTNLRRARTEAWVHHHDETFEVLRARPALEATPSAHEARGAAASAGTYIVRALQSDGRFRYKLFPERARGEMEPYSVARHAGTAWFLSELYESAGSESYLRSAEKALDWLEKQLASCGEGLRCVRRGDRARLGTQALSLIAFSTHARVTASDRYQKSIDQLSEVVLRLQRDDGDFDFTLDAESGRPVAGSRAFYAAGQAALALALAGQVAGDERLLTGARAALDFMAGPYWDFFLGDLFFLEEHWTCLAADEVHRLYGDPDHARLCLAVAGFNRRLQHHRGETVFPDYVGGVGFTPFFPPYTTSTATRAEAMIAAYRISKRRGAPDPELRRGIIDAVAFLAHNQYGRRDTYAFRSGSLAIGGVPWSYYDPVIRIDTVQHTGAVMLHGADAIADAKALDRSR